MPTLQQQTSYNWAIYHSGQTPARLVGFVDDAPNKQTAIARAIRELRVPMSERGRLMALRRG